MTNPKDPTHDFAVFPVQPGGKTPYPGTMWRNASKPRRRWPDNRWPEDANTGIDCGKSGLVVLDEDRPGVATETFPDLPDTYTVRTPRGRHLYFIAPTDIEVRNSASTLAKGLDVRAEGGYVVAAGSRLASGGRYKVERDMDPASLPQAVLDALTASGEVEMDYTIPHTPLTLPEHVEEGQRNDTLFRYAASLESRGVRDEEAEALLQIAFDRCTPPYTETTPHEMWTRVKREYREREPDLTALVQHETQREFTRLLARAEADRLLGDHRKAEFAQAIERADREGQASQSRFTVVTSADLRAKPVQPDLVEGVVGPAGTLNQISGHRGSMKSLTTIGLAAAVGGGMDEVYGLRVSRPGPVLYAYLEGAPGLSRRVAAWEAHHKRTMDGVYFTHDPMDMKRPEDVRDLAVLARSVGAVLVVLDSVAKSGGGKEDMEDFGAYRLGLESLRDALPDAAVLALHNTGHDKSRARGHTTLVDGMDSAVLLAPKTAAEGGGVEMRDEKSRDTAALENFRLNFQPAGPINPRTGQPWSGVSVRNHATTLDLAHMAYQDRVNRVTEAIEKAGGEITSKALAEALGVDRGNLTREIKDLLDGDVLVHNGKATTGRRYYLGGGAETYARPLK